MLSRRGWMEQGQGHAWVAELVDARDLKSLGAKSLYEFDSRPRHQKIQGVNPVIIKAGTNLFFYGLKGLMVRLLWGDRRIKI